MTIDDEVLYEKYNLEIDRYRGIGIDFDVLKIRTANCLKAARIYKLHQLLSSTYYKLSQIRNLGMLSLNDIDEYIKTLDDKNIERKEDSKHYISSRIKSHREKIFSGIFSEEVYDGLNDNEIEVVNRFKKGFELLDANLIKLCKEEPVSAYAISAMLDDFIRQAEKHVELDKLYDTVKEKTENLLKPYFEIYLLQADVSAEFAEYCENEEAVLDSLFDKTLTGGLIVEEKIKFVKWVSYDLRKELRDFLDGIYSRKSRNTKSVLELRARKLTLQAIGNELGITRERVRQIEKKVVQPFCQWQRTKK